MDSQMQPTIQIPVMDPLTTVEAAEALNVPVKDVYNAIFTGRLAATNIRGSLSTTGQYRIPLKNFVAFVNQRFSEHLSFKFPADDPLTIPRVARALRCSDQHVYNLISDGEFPNAFDLARRKSTRRDCRITLRDLIDFINRRREGAW